jgi:hypothetical protein
MNERRKHSTVPDSTERIQDFQASPFEVSSILSSTMVSSAFPSPGGHLNQPTAPRAQETTALPSVYFFKLKKYFPTGSKNPSATFTQTKGTSF